MVKYLAIVRALERRFQGFTLKYIPRAENSKADDLAKAAASNLPIPDRTFYQVLQVQTTQATAKAFKQVLLTESEDWRQLIIDQINNVQHSEDEASIARMAARARSYIYTSRLDPVQKRRSPNAAQMYNLGRRQGTPLRDSLQNLRVSHRPKSIVYKSH